MKSVLMSIQPYWMFLIIAHKMGWQIGLAKTVEVRKNYPKSKDWDKTGKLYCSKDKKSFARIPKEYRPLMEQFLGKVIGEFVCEKIDEYRYGVYEGEFCYHIPTVEGEKTCLEYPEAEEYGNAKPLYFWHISSLVIYDKPRELSEFRKECELECDMRSLNEPPCEKCDHSKITRPPQSWCYVESEVQGE